MKCYRKYRPNVFTQLSPAFINHHKYSSFIAKRVSLIDDFFLPVENKSILFVGDDDLASAVIGRLTNTKLTVIDIDNNILSVIDKQVKNKKSSFINANILDIVDKKKPDPIDNQFDAFVTDPPYTEVGYKYFLSYGIKHLKLNGIAFVAVPYMNMEDWSSELLYKVEDFLIKNGFVFSFNQAANWENTDSLSHFLDNISRSFFDNPVSGFLHSAGMNILQRSDQASSLGVLSTFVSNLPASPFWTNVLGTPSESI